MGIANVTLFAFTPALIAIGFGVWAISKALCVSVHDVIDHLAAVNLAPAVRHGCPSAGLGCPLGSSTAAGGSVRHNQGLKARPHALNRFLIFFKTGSGAPGGERGGRSNRSLTPADFGPAKCEVAHTSLPIRPSKVRHSDIYLAPGGVHGTETKAKTSWVRTCRRDGSCDGVEHPNDHGGSRFGCARLVTDLSPSTFAFVLAGRLSR